MIDFLPLRKQLISISGWGLLCSFLCFCSVSSAEVQLEYSRITLGGAEYQSERLSVQDSITFNVGQARGASSRFSVGTPHLFGNNGTVTAIDLNSVKLVWDADDSGRVEGFIIWRDPPGNPIDSVAGSATEYTDTSLETGLTYTYRIMASDAQQNIWNYLDGDLEITLAPDDATATPTGTATATETPTPTMTPTGIPVSTSTPTNTVTTTSQPTLTATPTPTPTGTPTATASETPTVTLSPTLTTTVTPTATATAVIATIKEMDMDGDDVICAGDLLRLIPAMRQNQGRTDQHHEGDFNRDGKVDCKDLWLLGNQWGREIVEEN